MVEGEGKVSLTGFDLEPAEKTIIDNLIKNYQSKLNEKVKYEELRLRMKKARHGKAFLHEIQGMLIGERKFEVKVTDYNLFSAISKAMKRLMSEVEHSQRTRRQGGNF